MPHLSLAMIATLSIVFGTSAWSKVRHRAAWQSFVDSLRPFATACLVTPLALTVAVIEIATALGLGIAATLAVIAPGRATPATVSVPVAIALLVVLTIGIAVSMARGDGARCACFGATDRPLSARHLARNAVLILCGVVALLAPPPGSDGAHLAGQIVAFVAAGVIALLVIRSDDLADLFGPSRSPSRIRR